MSKSFNIDSFRNEPANEKLTTVLLDNVSNKDKMTLYHGSPKDVTMIKANSFNMGNRLEGKSLSSFWASTFEYALVYALDWLFMPMGLHYIHDIDNEKIIIPNYLASDPKYPGPDKEDIPMIDYLKYYYEKRLPPLFVYEADIPVKYIGRGQVAINEYSVDHDVIPSKKTKITWEDILKVLVIVEPDEFNKLSSKCYYGADLRTKPLSTKEKLIFRNHNKTMRKRGLSSVLFHKPVVLKKAILNRKELQG